jgi:phospholipid/cholesterol/gamma-HCH transport system substrate-binding protein
MARIGYRAMERRVRLAEAVLAFIVVAGAVVVGRTMVAGPLFAGAYSVSVDLPAAAGLHEHADVAYRGQHIGTVTGVRLTSSGVRATLHIENDIPIPRDSDVVVSNLSAVGEQYVDFRPRTAAGPFLTDGSTIRSGDSSLPTPTWQVLANSQRLLGRVNTDDLATITHEVNAIFGSGDADLPGLLDEVDRTLAMLERITPSVLQLVDEGEKPLATLDDLSPDVRKLVDNSRKITKQLRRSNPTIKKLINEGSVLIPVLVKDFDSVSPILVRMMDDGAPVAAMAEAHLPGLLHWYKWGPDQMVAMADATRNKSAHVILVITLADNCRYTKKEIGPFEENVKLPLAARCTTVDPHVQQRGSQYAPHPD